MCVCRGRGGHVITQQEIQISENIGEDKLKAAGKAKNVTLDAKLRKIMGDV